MVRSTFASAVCEVCMLHRPQSSGHVTTALDLRIRQAEIVAEVPLLHLEVQLDVAEDDVAKLPVLGALTSAITTLPSSAKMSAGMTLVHSGQSDSVCLGKPFCSGLMGAPV